MFLETKSPALGSSVSWARKIQVRSKIRSISRRYTSSFTKMSRLTRPRWTSTHSALVEGRDVEDIGTHLCEISLTLQISPCADMWQAAVSSFQKTFDVDKYKIQICGYDFFVSEANRLSADINATQADAKGKITPTRDGQKRG